MPWTSCGGPRPGDALGTDLKGPPLSRLGDNVHGVHGGRESGVGPRQHVLDQIQVLRRHEVADVQRQEFVPVYPVSCSPLRFNAVKWPARSCV